jgi:hypothetical protein
MLRFFVSLSPVTKNVCAALFLALVTICLFWPLLFQDRILFFGDISLYFTPLLHFQRAEVVGQGRLPLWNPQILCGTPFVGNPQVWPLYPSSLLLYALSAERVTGITGAIHVFWAALGTYAFLLLRGRSRPAALLGAVSWAFGAVLVSKMQFPNMVQAASWLPWLLLACEGVLCRPGPARSVLLGLVVGPALLAAHPQMVLLQCYLGFAFVLWRLSSLKEDRRRRSACLVMGFVLGLGLAAAQLLPTLELVRHSVRPDLPLEKANSFILPPYAVLTNFLAPNFYGNPALPGNPYVGRGNFWEPCCYIGVLPFLLFLCSVLFRSREAETRFWLLAGLVGVWLAVGRDAWLFGLAFQILPGINRFHDAARFLIPATFALACLAASGLDTVMKSLRRRPRSYAAAVVLLLTVIDVTGFSRTLNPTIDARELHDAIGSGDRQVPTEGRLFQTDESRIWGAFVSYRTYEALSDRGQRRAFLQSLAPNLSLLSGWRSSDGYEPVRLAVIDILLKPVKDAARNGTLEPTDARLDLLAVNRLASWNRVPGRTRLVPRPSGSRRSRAALWLDWQNVGSAADAFTMLNGGEWKGLPLVTDGARFEASLRRTEFRSLRLRVVDTSPVSVEIMLPSPHPPGLVALADVGFPGWTVTTDGKAADPLCINGAFRGVVVGTDARLVRWTFASNPWRVGLFISLLTVGIMAVMVAPAVDAFVRSLGLTRRQSRA